MRQFPIDSGTFECFLRVVVFGYGTFISILFLDTTHYILVFRHLPHYGSIPKGYTKNHSRYKFVFTTLINIILIKILKASV